MSRFHPTRPPSQQQSQQHSPQHVWLEIGNTLIKWLTCSHSQPSHAWIDEHHQIIPVQSLLEHIKSTRSSTTHPQELELGEPFRFAQQDSTQVFISISAQNPHRLSILNYFNDFFKVPIQQITHLPKQSALSVNYDPQQYGVDRYLASLACLDQRSTVIVDCGSAITVDAWLSDYQHQGGWIIPSPQFSQKVYQQSLAHLGLSIQMHPGSSHAIDISLAQTTQGNILNGYSSMVVHWLKSIRNQTEQILGNHYERFVITGNAAPSLIDENQAQWEVIPNLALKGLVKYSNQRQ